ncbi:hypothetical protein PUR61_45090, partial [Streptomyces sp. BE20]|nr:hypothetical protein [Streptomyces sp. BE20]
MSTPRSLILAGATALVLSTVPVGVAGAATGAASAGPSAPAPHIDVPLQRGLEPSVTGVPREFEVGGAPREFRYTVTNPTAHDVVAFALVHRAATTHGALAVKLFPALFGGPAYLNALRAPFPDVPFVPVGGIDATAALAYL